MTISSETRICTVHSPLGEDALILHEFFADEHVSDLFEFTAQFTSTNLEIDFAELLGQSICIEARLGDGEPRYFNGIVSQFSQQDDDVSNNAYHAEIVPWLWLTTHSTNCRIFQDKTVIEIIQAVFDDLNLPDYEIEVLGRYEPIPYCVQYRESDFNFVSRLMESAGIAYYFRHELKLHTMVLFDSPSANADCPGQAEAMYVGHVGEEETAGRVLSWRVERELRPGVFSHTDYDYTDPSLDLSTQQSVLNSVEAASGLEVYEYPGEYTSLKSGESIAKLRVEAEELASHTIEGESSSCGFCPGYKFALVGHYRSSFDDTYLLTDVHHSISQPVGADRGGSSVYTNTFRCTPHSLPYRPPRRAEKPVIQGMQPAKVVSIEGKDIDVDEYGRVLVRFPWDRAENGACCRVRVSQNWAGKKWGGMFFPHVGQEVLVCFLEGDPDRPIVAGRVYNAENMPPLERGAATQSIIRDHGGNQIIMEGADGSQRISMYSPHGETKFNIGAPNSPDEGVWLETLLNQNVKIGGNMFERIDGNEDRTVDGNTTQTVAGDETNTTVGKKKEDVKGQVIQMNADLKSTNTLGLTQDTFVGGKLSTFHGYAHSINRGWKRTIDSASVVKEAADKKVTIKNDYEFDIGSEFFVDAGTKIEFKCGGSSLEITPDGISIIGKAVTIDSTSGNILVNSKSDIVLKPAGKVNIPKGALNDKNMNTN